MDKKKAKKDIDSGLTEEEKRVRAEQRKRAAKKKRKKIIKTLIVVFIILAIVGFALWKFFDLKRREEAANTLLHIRLKGAPSRKDFPLPVHFSLWTPIPLLPR